MINDKARYTPWVRILGIGLLAAWPSGCGHSPTSPSVISVAGTWVGTNTNSLSPGSRPAQATIAQSGTNLSGTWSATTPGGTDSGPLSGSIAGNTLAISFFSAVPQGACHYEVSTTVSGNQMTGTWTTVSCVTPANGTITLTKQ